MGMCAIYTSVKPPSEDEIVVLARNNEQKTYGPRRCMLGRIALAQLVQHIAPPTHAELAATIVARDLWGFLTPAATRGNHAAMLQRAHQDVPVPVPLWPESVEMACLVGAPPAEYLGNNLVLLRSEIVAIAVVALKKHERASEEAAYLNEFLRGAVDREDAVLLHWDYR